jgi:hypothetical protein
MYYPGPHLYVRNGCPRDTLPLERYKGHSHGERMIGLSILSNTNTLWATGTEETISGDSVQLAGRCKHDIGFYDNGDKTGGSADGTIGAVVGCDIKISREFNTQNVSNTVGFCDDGDKNRDRLIGQLSGPHLSIVL